MHTLTCVDDPQRSGHQQRDASFIELKDVLEHYSHVAQEKGDTHRQVFVFVNPTALPKEKSR